MTPRATMRLQFHKAFSFADAERHVPYFARLGISHVYASPITTARPGSMHGYDVIDPTRVNPELGGQDGLRRLVNTLRRHGLGLIVDIVPNHMAVGAANPWWSDMLRHGRASRYARYFDIDWEAPGLDGKVLLPVLGRPLHEVLDAGELSVEGDDIRYFDHRFPLRPDGDSRASLPDLIAHQHYRLAWWRVANDEINWRRFFDINELAALRMEHAEAFEDVHALIFRLYAEGLIDGVRIDHVDGLSDPARYCIMLCERLEALTDQRPADAPRRRPYLVVEKILLRGEALPAEWPIDGTSGYDFMNEVSAVQHDAEGDASLAEFWHRVSGRPPDFPIEEQAARREIIPRSFSAQLDACARSFRRLSAEQSSELSLASIKRALAELLAHFPVYRTYGTSDARPPRDRKFLDAAAAAARRTCFPMDREVVDRIVNWLSSLERDVERAGLQTLAVTQFQQLSAPIAAKAVEDTAFYRYGRLLSRNDVGFDPTRFADSAADFHAHALRRRESFPHSMLATATHDHKRGEDVRARLATLSEFATEWVALVPDWIEQCRALRRDADGIVVPRPGDIAILLQMIVGAWPLDLDISDAKGRAGFAARLAQWQEKALREAKLETDWTIPDAPYETTARELLLALVERNAVPALLDAIVAFAQRIAPAGAVNGFAQTLLKLTAPGVPDIYQGTEFWDLSLVDPDNRRAVNFAARAASLDDAPMPELASRWRDGHIKQALIARTLAFRRERPKLFSEGVYQPIEVRGRQAARIIAFARRFEGHMVITIVPRTASRLLRRGEIAFEAGAWQDTAIMVPDRMRLTNLLDGEVIVPKMTSIPVSAVLERLPVTLLTA